VNGIGEPGKYEGMDEIGTTGTKTPRVVKNRDDCRNFMLFAANERKERKAIKAAKGKITFKPLYSYTFILSHFLHIYQPFVEAIECN